MANKKKKQEMRSLLGAWVCDLANRLCNESETSITRAEAFRRAHLTRELLEMLGAGKVTFQYEKRDGTLREAQGTLRAGIDPMFDAFESKESRKEKNYSSDAVNFTYWDLGVRGFRTFSALRIVKIIALSIPNFNEHESH